MILPQFGVGEKVFDRWMRMAGTVVQVRNDTYEQEERKADARHGFYYHIEYDNGKFNTYVSEASLAKQELSNDKSCK
jgi:heat shock protein HspQ